MKASNITKGEWRQIERGIYCGDELIAKAAIVGEPAEFLANTTMMRAAPMLAEALVGILAWNEGKLREYQMPPLLRDASRAALLSAGYTEE